MTKQQLIDILLDNKWEWAEHKHQEQPGIAYKKELERGERKFHITEEGIQKTTPTAFDSHLKSQDVVHITRIVGYYSKVHNWNPSKLGELKDRQNGAHQIGDYDSAETIGGNDGSKER